MKNHHILYATKFEVHVHNFSEVSKGVGCGGTINVRTTREAYQVFYRLILFLKGIF